MYLLAHLFKLFVILVLNEYVRLTSDRGAKLPIHMLMYCNLSSVLSTCIKRFLSPDFFSSLIVLSSVCMPRFSFTSFPFLFSIAKRLTMRFEPSTSQSNTWHIRPQDHGALLCCYVFYYCTKLIIKHNWIIIWAHKFFDKKFSLHNL